MPTHRFLYLTNFKAFHLDSYLAVYDPNCSSAKIFKLCVLPFGSIASVTAFLRVSLALWKLGFTLLHLMWSVYFDDFLCLARSSESKHVDFCVDALFSLLGWKKHIQKQASRFQHSVQSSGSPV